MLRMRKRRKSNLIRIFFDGQKFRRQWVNVFDTTWGLIYFLTCENFGRKFQTQCAETFIEAVWRFIKNKVNWLFPNARIRRKATQILFFPPLGTERCLLVFRASLTFGFCIDLRVSLYCKHYSTYANRWAGLNRQRCRSRRWSFSAEAVLIHTLLHHRAEHSTSCHFGRLPSI